MIQHLPQTKLATVFSRLGKQTHLTLFRAFVVCLLLSLTCEQAIAQDSTAGQNAKQWTADLGSPEFVTRETAAEKLLSIGKPAIAALQSAIDSNDANIAVRAKQILSQIQAKLQAGQTDEDIEIWQQLKDNPGRARNVLFQQIVANRDVRLTFQVLDKYPDLATAFFAGDATQFHNMLLDVVANDEWEDAKWAVERPITIRKSPATCYHFHHIQGTLNAFIGSQIAELEKIESPVTDSNSQQRIKALMSMLRMQRRFDDADRFLQMLPASSQEEFRRQILLEQGVWQSLLSECVSPANKIPGDGKITANQPQQAFLQKLAGDDDAYEATIQELEATVRTAIADKNALLGESAKGQLRMIGLTNLDNDLLKKHLDTNNELENYTLYSEMFRYQDAFDLIQFGDDVKSRSEWMNARIQRMKEISKELVGMNRREKEYQSLSKELNEIRGLIISISDHLGLLGFDDEADMYLQMLFAADEKFHTTRNRVLMILMVHERYDTIWALLENGLAQRTAVSTSLQLFADRFPGVSGISGAINSRYPSKLDQIKVMATLTRSPLLKSSKFDFDTELARYRSGSAFATNGSMEWFVSQILELNGQFAESEQLLREGAKLGNYSAINQIASTAYRRGEYAYVASELDQHWRLRRNPAEALIAADCYRRLAAQESDPVRRNELEKKQKTASFAAIASWYARSYSVTTAVRTLEQFNAPFLANFLLQSNVYSLTGATVSNERYRVQLVQAFTHADSQRTEQGGIESAIHLYNSLAANNNAAQSAVNWSKMGESTLIAIAKGEILKGQHRQGVDRLIRCAKFHLTNSSIGESILPILDEAGAQEDADRLFQELSSPFADLLTRYPNSALHRNNYAWLCVCGQRRMENVDRHIQLARQLRPHNSSYCDTLAQIKFMRGEFDEAIRLSEECISLNPRKQFYRIQREKFLTAKEQASAKASND